jgi:hypothetical protein
MSARKDWAVAFWARKLLIVAGSTPVIPLVAEATVWAVFDTPSASVLVCSAMIGNFPPVFPSSTA